MAGSKLDIRKTVSSLADFDVTGQLASIAQRFGNGWRSLHIGIFSEPYLGFILEGRKTIESRFSKNRISPFESVFKGDIVFLKSAGGPVVGFFEVGGTWCYQLKAGDLKEIEEKFSKQICPAGSDFWESRKDKTYATLLKIGRVQVVDPIEVVKRDRRGWVTLR